MPPTSSPTDEPHIPIPSELLELAQNAAASAAKWRDDMVAFSIAFNNAMKPSIMAALSFTEMVAYFQREEHDRISAWENEGGYCGDR